MKNKFYITTPIYYVNDTPHIGSAYTTVAADVLARWHRQVGDKTFFLTGTDEHGAKVASRAEEAGKKPQEFVDEVAGQYITAWKNLHISHDRFIRTTQAEHIKAVQNALQFMYDQGDIYLGKYEGLYCEGCEQYKSQRDLIDGQCADHGTIPEKMSEECYLFKLSKYQSQLLEKIKSDEFIITPTERKNEIVSFYEKEGLDDVAFSRKNVKWGIPLPFPSASSGQGDNSQTAYVWADAFLNYLTGLGWDVNPPTPLSKGGESGDSANTPLVKGGEGSYVFEFWPPDIQLMSKDILRIHATVWPAMLESLGLPLPKQLLVHGFFLVDSKKMSKSLGNVIRPDEMITRYGVDATRYLLLSATPFGNDGDVSWAKFDAKYNADLANGLGNLVARVTTLIEKNGFKYNLSQDAGKFGKEFKKFMDELALEAALRFIWDNLRALDMELARKKPWKEEDKEKIKNILEPVAQNILSLAILIEPFMPGTAVKVIEQFKTVEIKKADSLFPRI